MEDKENKDEKKLFVSIFSIIPDFAIGYCMYKKI